MKTRMLPLLLAIAALLGACGDSYDRADFIEEMTTGENAFTEEQANCIADGVEAEFDIERLNSNDDLTAEETEIVSDLAISCVLGG